MEATIYNRHTSFNKRAKPAIIRIDTEKTNARIRFSVEAVKELGLETGDCLSFITLKNDKYNIYFTAVVGVPANIHSLFKPLRRIK